MTDPDPAVVQSTIVSGAREANAEPGHDRPAPGDLERQAKTRQRIWYQEHFTAFAVFTLLTFAFTWPLVLGLSVWLPAPGDPFDSCWRLGVIARQLLHDPLDLYHGHTFYPYPTDVALDEIVTGNAILAAPIIWLTGNPVLAFNLLTVGNYLLSGFAMYLLASYLTGSWIGGMAAGVTYGFCPNHIVHVGHIGVAAQQWLVFGFYCLVRYLQDPSRIFRTWWLWLFAVFFTFQALAAGYNGYMEAVIIGVYVGYFAVRSWTRRSDVRLAPSRVADLNWQIGGLCVVAVLSAAALIPIVWPFVTAQRALGFHRSLSEVRSWSASPLGLLRVPDGSLLAATRPWTRNWIQRSHGSERALYPGVIPLLLVFVELLSLRHSRQVVRRHESSVFILIAVVGLLLSFGPYLKLAEARESDTGIPLPYLVLYRLVPGFDALRVPYRFGTVFMFGVAIAAAFGARRVADWRPWGRASGVFTALIVLEFWAQPVHPTTIALGDRSPDSDGLYGWLARPESRAVVPEDALLIELPITMLHGDNQAGILQSLYHRRPMLNGTGNVIPVGYERLVEEMHRFPSSRSLDVLAGLRVQFVLVHVDWLSRMRRQALEEERSRLELVQEGGPHRLYRVVFPRVDDLRATIPAGSSIALSDGRGLYTTAFAGILGPEYRYVASRNTVYTALFPTLRVQPASRSIEYVVAYNSSDASTELDPCAYQNVVWANEVVKVCRVASPSPRSR
jgi:hypothetical protein